MERFRVKWGGLALLWTNEVDLSISSYSSRHIDAMVKSNDGLIWRFTGVYGDPVTSNRHLFWD